MKISICCDDGIQSFIALLPQVSSLCVTCLFKSIKLVSVVMP